MEIYRGKCVSGGVAIGRIRVYHKNERRVNSAGITDADAEMERFWKAREETIGQLRRLYEKAYQEAGAKAAAIFQAHEMILEDDNYNKLVENIVRARKGNAEYAVAAAADSFAQMFAAMKDEHMRRCAEDVRDISQRLVTALRGDIQEGFSLGGPAILVAEDLTPSETVLFDRREILAFVLVHGSLNSHAAILAGAMGIPVLIGAPVPIDDSLDDKTAAVDGINGALYVNPDEKTLEEMRKRQETERERKLLFQTLKGGESVTADGRKVRLYANIGHVRDLTAAIQNDAEGIGLFRSEFLYLESGRYPTEEEQFRIYRQAAETMGGRKVIIRTFDIGADKQCDYFHMEQEENPALGCRGIRVCLNRPEIFKTQLRALYRAGAYGKIAILYPMITSVKELRRAREMTALVREELDHEKIRRGDPEQGIMIETPAAALISDVLAKEADFFSIGTNDLTQYTLAMDRQNPKLDEFYDARHPAVLRMISMVTENAHKAGIQVGICGELGADLSLTKEFLAMGVDEFSVSPVRILPLRKIVRETNVEEYRAGRCQQAFWGDE